MQYFPHLNTNETSYITVRLNKAEREHLREWMHIPEGERVAFPHGVKLFYRAEGWYRLDTTNSHRAMEKLRTALALLRAWFRHYQEAVAQEIRLRIVALNPKLQVTSYQSDTHQFQVRDKDSGAVKPIQHAAQAPTPNQLAALAAKFGSKGNSDSKLNHVNR